MPEIGTEIVYLEVEAEYTDNGIIQTDKQPVMIGNWSAGSADFVMDVAIENITVWGNATEEPDDGCGWYFVFYVNDESKEYSADCLNDGSEISGETFTIDEIVTLQPGDTFGVEIWYEGLSLIHI